MTKWPNGQMQAIAQHLAIWPFDHLAISQLPRAPPRPPRKPARPTRKQERTARERERSPRERERSPREKERAARSHSPATRSHSRIARARSRFPRACLHFPQNRSRRARPGSRLARSRFAATGLQADEIGWHTCIHHAEGCRPPVHRAQTGRPSKKSVSTFLTTYVSAGATPTL